MDPAPDAGQLRDDAVDTRPATLGYQNLEHDHNHDFDLDLGHGHPSHHNHQQHIIHTLSIQSQPSSTPYIDSDLGNSLHDGLAAGSTRANIPDSYPTTYRDHTSVENDRHAPPSSIDPDDFYKNYRGLDTSTTPDILPMATTASSRPSLRSNGDGTTPKHPTVPANRNLPRSNLRSVSSPLDSRSAATNTPPRTMPTGKPSVKDLKKRFDQNAMVGVPTIPPPPARAAAVSKPSRSRTGALEHSSAHAATARDKQQSPAGGSAIGGAVGSSSLPLRQSKFVADDHASTSSQSFASRINKPRSHAEAELSSPPQTHPQPPSTSTGNAQPKGLLFGEIPPNQHDVRALGYGIDGVRPRRTSESSIQHPTTHHRSFSGHDAEQNVPATWYRDPATQIEEAPITSSSRPRPRSRAHSDDGASSPSSRSPRNSRPKPSTHSSRLPVSVRKFSTPSNSTSPSSTRSSSPSTLKRYQANGRPIRTSPGATRAKTPTQSRKPPPQGLVTPNNNSNNRLRAYISAPAPKLSPTLRSSRPRQPVSINPTTSSRMKESDRTKTSKAGESTSRRRKISVGPIDFAQRREHIRLAYTKSIRESAALEARHKASTEKRQHNLGNTVAAEQSIEISTPEIHSEVPDAVSGDGFEGPNVVQDAKPGDSEAQGSTESAKSLVTPPLTISTERQTTAIPLDSPTLGLPGSFPGQSPPMLTDEPPPSAVSATSDTTEFDAEPQTNPPVHAQSTLTVPITVVNPPSPQKQQDPHRSRTEYRYPFEDDPDSPARVSPKKERSSLPTPDFDDIPAVPGSFVDDHRQPNGLGIGSFQSQDTDITLVPASQSQVISGPDDAQTIPFPRLEAPYDSDCPSDFGHIQTQRSEGRPDDDAITDTCTEETDDREQPDMRHSHFHHDQLQSYRTSTCASSEVDNYDDMEYSSYEQHQRQEQQGSSPPNNLLMPSSTYHDERFSRQSGWTDFSVDSTDRSDPMRSPAVPSSRESPAFGHVTIFSSNAESSLRNAQHNRPELRDSEDSRRSSTHYSSHHLPEVDTGDGFSVPYLSQETNDKANFVPSPIHEPPPIPTSLPGSGLNSRTSSAFYDQTQYESTLLNSERGSDDFMSHAGTSRSVDSTSLATTDQYVSTQTPADSDTKSLAHDGEELTDKERHRLVQRRNVIKELVDTEAVFVRDMNIVEEIYKGTAEACPKLDGKTIKLIFRNSDEIIAFHTSFLAELKEAVTDVYIPKGARTMPRDDSSSLSAPSFTATGEPNDAKDRCTSLGPVFRSNVEQMKEAHEGFLRASDQAAKRLIQIQQDPTVQVWLNECNEVAKDLTAAWDLDSLLIKPMQRITKYPNLIITLLQYTPQDHPDRTALMEAKDILETAIVEINKTKKNFELVGQIVGRKRKESDVKAGFARAFGKRVDKLQASNNRPAEDADYAKLNEKFGDDYLRLQVVLRDVEFYTRQVSAYVHEFLQYMSSIELVMRLQPGSYPELESKWVQFNISVRDLEKVALEEHLAQVRKHVIEPFEHVIKAYGNPSLAMKKRQKRRVDYERFEQLKRGGKSPDPKLKELVEQYEALNDTLKKELPLLSGLTEKVGNICLGNFVNIQAKWYAIWKEKMKAVLTDGGEMPDLQEVVSTFERDFPYAHDQMAQIGILNPATWGRTSLSTSMSVDDTSLRTRGRPSDVETRSRGQSVNGDIAPTLPTPDFGGRRSGSFTMSPSHSTTGFGNGNVPSPHQYYYRDYYAGIHSTQAGSASPRSPEIASSSRSVTGTGMASTRPSTGRSYESGVPRQSSDSAVLQHRDSSTSYNSNYVTQETPRESHRFSNMFHSALPLSDGPEEGSSSQRASRASSRERNQTSDGYNVLWLAASLFEFNIATTKHEAGYPYLTYQAGEIFDVIAEKGELWLAKNQDDPTDQVGWIWSKHFAKLADS